MELNPIRRLEEWGMREWLEYKTKIDQTPLIQIK